jgi:hypothetical protein
LGTQAEIAGSHLDLALRHLLEVRYEKSPSFLRCRTRGRRRCFGLVPRDVAPHDREKEKEGEPREREDREKEWLVGCFFFRHGFSMPFGSGVDIPTLPF